MRRRTRIDLGQSATSAKDGDRLDRKRQRWAEVNKDKPAEENPFLVAIRPDQEQFGEVDEKGDELRQRLNNLEFGNFPGYFKYRTKAAAENKNKSEPEAGKESEAPNVIQKEGEEEELEEQDDLEAADKSTLDDGLSDERLRYFQREWFEGKDVLDVGCNRGHIDYAISRLFSPNLVVGIDIDLKMIQMANRDLHLHLEKGLISEANELRRRRAAQIKLGDSYTEDPHHYPLSSYITQGPLAASLCSSQRVDLTNGQPPAAVDGNNCSEIELDSFRGKFPNNIVFLEHNYVLSKDELLDKQAEQFDVVVCLSVTKWIHLNYRDSGLKRFFRRVYRHLRPNGLFILEAQPFDNYARRKKLSDRLRANFYNIQFKPDQFEAYLLSGEVGFRKIIYETVTEHECVGFKRPMKVFLK